MSRRKKLLVLPALLLMVMLTAAFVSKRAYVNAESEHYEGLKTFTEVLTVIKRSYVETTDTKTLIYGAIRGILGSLDPHSAFLTAEDYKDMQVETKGEFGGIGIQIGVKDGLLTVIAPIEETPAWKAGIKTGDRILKVNGEPTKKMTLHEAVSKMRGQKGTQVTITVMREGWKNAQDFTLTRDIIKVKSVRWKALDGNVGYVKVIQFQEDTADELSSALKKLDEEKIHSLILDLRNNPGGLLQSAVDIAGQFLPEGKLVTYLKGRTTERADYNTAGGYPVRPAVPMVVLVNQGSASASEIVAGALKDWGRAVILGNKTFGKGSVQSVIPLSDGSALRLTTARYYTPKGTSIQSTGITPDIEVKLEVKEGAKEHPVIREKDLERHLENEKGEETEMPAEETAFMGEIEEKDDTQLQRAVDLLKTWHVFKEISDK